MSAAVNMNLTDIGYISASRFTRLSAAGIKNLQPVTILLADSKPVAVAIEFSRYMEMQEMLIAGLEAIKA